MRRVSIAGAVGVAALLAFVAVASGATPKKGGVYVGDIKSSPFEMHVSVGVSASGKGARITYLCGTGRPPTTVNGVSIDSTGHFKFTASAQDWKLAGHFTSVTKAFVSLNSIACGGSKGSTTLTLKQP